MVVEFPEFGIDDISKAMFVGGVDAAMKPTQPTDGVRKGGLMRPFEWAIGSRTREEVEGSVENRGVPQRLPLAEGPTATGAITIGMPLDWQVCAHARAYDLVAHEYALRREGQRS